MPRLKTYPARFEVVKNALICAADMSTTAKAPPAQRLQIAAENRESLAASAQEMADEMATITPADGFATAAPGLAKKPLLVLTSDGRGVSRAPPSAGPSRPQLARHSMCKLLPARRPITTISPVKRNRRRIDRGDD